MKVILITQVVDSYHFNLPGTCRWILRRHLRPLSLTLRVMKQSTSRNRNTTPTPQNKEWNCWEKENSQAQLQSESNLVSQKEIAQHPEETRGLTVKSKLREIPHLDWDCLAMHSSDIYLNFNFTSWLKIDLTGSLDILSIFLMWPHWINLLFHLFTLNLAILIGLSGHRLNQVW